ncbi:MAG: hypothetical protein ABIZ49_01890 [Opitutaceae bacterium]
MSVALVAALLLSVAAAAAVVLLLNAPEVLSESVFVVDVLVLGSEVLAIDDEVEERGVSVAA